MAALTPAEQQAMAMGLNPNTKTDIQKQTGVSVEQVDKKTGGTLTGTSKPSTTTTSTSTPSSTTTSAPSTSTSTSTSSKTWSDIVNEAIKRQEQEALKRKIEQEKNKLFTEKPATPEIKVPIIAGTPTPEFVSDIKEGADTTIPAPTPTNIYAPTQIGSATQAAEVTQKVKELEAEKLKEKEEQEKTKEKVKTFFNKLADIGITFGGPLGLVLGKTYKSIMDKIEKNQKSGQDALNGLTTKEMNDIYNAANEWYISNYDITGKPITEDKTMEEEKEKKPVATTSTASTPTTTPTITTPTEKTPEQETTTPTTETTTRYEDLLDKYKQSNLDALAEYNKNVEQARQDYLSSYDTNIAKATEQARRLSDVQAGLSQAQQQTALRNAGLSSNAAAILSSQNIARDYMEAFNKNYTESLSANEERTINAFNNAIDTQVELLKQNRDILNQEIEYQGKLVSIKSLLQEIEFKRRQFDIAMEQYKTAKTETEKANLWNNILNGANFAIQTADLLTSLITGNETGASKLAEGVYVVGEKGPEVVELPEDARVVPASVSATIIRSDTPKKDIEDFFENHNMINKKDFPVDNSIMLAVGKIENYIKKNKPKDWNSLMNVGIKEGDYKEKLEKLNSLF